MDISNKQSCFLGVCVVILSGSVQILYPTIPKIYGYIGMALGIGGSISVFIYNHFKNKQRIRFKNSKNHDSFEELNLDNLKKWGEYWAGWYENFINRTRRLLTATA